MLEYEKKVLLTKEEYIAIINIMGKSPLETRQINYYFDTNDLSMNSKGITCRIREKDGRYQATIKKHNAEQAEHSIEEDISTGATLDASAFESMGLSYQCELITDRTTLYMDSFCDVVVDRNTYLGHTDYELEIEYWEKGKGHAQVLVERIAAMLVAEDVIENPESFLVREGRGKNKSQRFFERKQMR